MVTQTEHPETFNPPQQPHAVSITVFLSPESFEPYMNFRLPLQERETLRDIKVDAYFNGALLSSKIISERFARSKHLNNELIIRFTGRPFSEQREQALIFVPPGQNPDGSLQENKRKKGSAVRRWEEISMRLNEELEKCLPADGPTSLTESLQDLARVQMPAEIEQLHRGGRTFSIVDVVVTSGALTEKPVPEVPGTNEGKINAQDVLNPASQPRSRRSTTSRELDNYGASVMVAGSSRTSVGTSLAEPISLREGHNPQMSPGYGYAYVSKVPQTLEEKIKEIEKDAMASTGTAVAGEGNTKRSRITRGKSRRSTTNDVSPAFESLLRFMNFGRPYLLVNPRGKCCGMV